MPEVARQPDQLEPLVALVERQHQLVASVGAAVVDEHDLGRAVQPVEDGTESTVELVQGLPLVEDRKRRRDVDKLGRATVARGYPPGGRSRESDGHTSAGSMTRFTYAFGVDVERLEPASFHPVPDCFTPPKPMCGSLPWVPPLTTTTLPDPLGERIARWMLAVWIADGEPVRRVVDERERLLEAADAVEDRDRAEQLRRRRSPRPARHPRGRRRDATSPADRAARRHDARSPASPAGDRAEHALQLASLITGPVGSSRARPRARVAELLVDRVEDDDPAGRRAALARVRERRGQRPGDGAVEIGVVADDERVLAAELEADLREPPPSRLVDPAPGRRRAREADEIDVADARRAAPASGPSPCTTLSTPGGSPAS